MVTIQPFQYEKTTAFKERVQIANKVNEIVNLFNELDIEGKINIFNEEIAIINGKITEINNALNEVNTAVNTVEGYNTRLISVENKNTEQDTEINKIENENFIFNGNKGFSRFIDFGVHELNLTINKWVIFCETTLNTEFNDRNLLIAFFPRHCENGIELIDISTRYINNTLFKRITTNIDSRYTFGVKVDKPNNKISWLVKSQEVGCAFYPMMANHMGSLYRDAVIKNSENIDLKFNFVDIETEYIDSDITFIFT